RAPPGEAIRAALPPGTRIGAKLLVELTAAGRDALAGGALPRGQRDLFAAIEAAGGSMRRAKLPRLPRGALETALAAGTVQLAAETEKARVRERTERVARLARPLTDSDRDALARAHVRREVLEAVAEAGEIPVAALRERFKGAAAHLRRL